MESKLTPMETAQRIGAGMLLFPVTPFTRAFAFDERRYRENLELEAPTYGAKAELPPFCAAVLHPAQSRRRVVALDRAHSR